MQRLLLTIFIKARRKNLSCWRRDEFLSSLKAWIFQKIKIIIKKTLKDNNKNTTSHTKTLPHANTQSHTHTRTLRHPQTRSHKQTYTPKETPTHEHLQKYLHPHTPTHPTHSQPHCNTHCNTHTHTHTNTHTKTLNKHLQKIKRLSLCNGYAKANHYIYHLNKSLINQLWIFQFAPVVDSAENIPPRLSLNLHSAKFSASSLDDRNRHE